MKGRFFVSPGNLLILRSESSDTSMEQNAHTDRFIDDYSGEVGLMRKLNWLTILISFILVTGIICIAQAEGQPGSSDVIGRIVTFGRYEQDGNEANGPEPIEWIVLDVQEGKALLLSRYGLDHLPYNAEEKNVTWESCSLRKWLNGEFLQAAFTSEELKSIPEATVDNSKSQCFSRWKNAKGGNDTTDRVFLLSYAEANRYLGVSWYEDGSEKAQMEATDYAARDAHRRIPGFENPEKRSYCHWWLRSPGAEQTDASDVTSSGNLVTSGTDSDFPFVRPAIWLDLKVMIQ